jgi:hypothetical protein
MQTSEAKLVRLFRGYANAPKTSNILLKIVCHHVPRYKLIFIRQLLHIYHILCH